VLVFDIKIKVIERGTDGHFQLGSQLYLLGNAAARKSGLIQTVHPYLVQINHETKLSAFLGMRSGLHAVIIDKVDDAFDLKISSDVGMRLSVFAGAGGKALLSALPNAEIDRILADAVLKPYTPKTITEKAAFKNVSVEATAIWGEAVTAARPAYWNPFIETLPREQLQQIQLKNFRRMLSYAQSRSAFYRRLYGGIDPEAIQTMDDVRALPLVCKDDLRAAQDGKEPFLFGEMLAVNPEEVSTFRQTSGTTGKPVYVPESYESWQWRVEVWCHILWMAGFREDDRVFIPFGYNVYVAFWEGHFAAEKLGCMVVPGGALDTVGRINKLLEVKATALLNTPTYGRHLAGEAQKMGLSPRDLGIRRMLCAGEPLPEASRKRLEDLWDAEVYDHIGGTEPCAWAAMCCERQGLHVMEPFFLVEILDLETARREVAEGELGTAVVTPLGRRSFPMIRFNTQDVVRKGKIGCSCGRTSLKIQEVAGRTDHLRKIRGVLFTPVAVEDLLRGEFPEIPEYEILVQKQGEMDEIALRFEPPPELGAAALKETTVRLAERLKVKTNLRFRLIPEPPGTLERYTLKARRFKDLR
jgi:phenylacetate-CoA ligase